MTSFFGNVDSPTPLCSPADLQQGAFADLTRAVSVEALTDTCIEASRACETEVEGRFMAFTITDSIYAEGIDPNDLSGGGYTGGFPIDQLGARGGIWGSPGGQPSVRRVYLSKYARCYPDMWAYTNVSATVATTLGATASPATITSGPAPDTGALLLSLGTYCPPGSLISVTYSGGYTTVPADLRRAAKYMAAAILCRELDPQSTGGHDPSSLEQLAAGWLNPYRRLT